MNINVDYESYCTIMNSLSQAYAPLSAEWGRYSDNVSTMCCGTKSNGSAFTSYYAQLYRMCCAVENYHNLLSANVNAIDAAVQEFLRYDSDSGASISGT